MTVLSANILPIIELHLMKRMGLVGTEEIRNSQLQFCEFERQISMFYIQSAFLFAL